MDAQLEVAIEQNHAILRVARAVGSPESNLKSQVDDMLDHWKQWRPAIEEKITRSEIESLHSIREIEEGARERDQASESRAAALYQKLPPSARSNQS